MIFHRSRIKENVSNKVVINNKELIKVEIKCKISGCDNRSQIIMYRPYHVCKK